MSSSRRKFRMRFFQVTYEDGFLRFQRCLLIENPYSLFVSKKQKHFYNTNRCQWTIVGGKVETLSLTHSRPLLDDNAGFVIVSRSVKKELNDDISNPCFSISSLRSIEGTEKTELTTLTSISSLPIPNFLMHRVAFYGADDFFCNLRKITT
jgi:hypothetical protein